MISRVSDAMMFYLLYDSNRAWSHGDHGGDGVLGLWTELSDLLDINWTKKAIYYIKYISDKHRISKESFIC